MFTPMPKSCPTGLNGLLDEFARYIASRSLIVGVLLLIRHDATLEAFSTYFAVSGSLK